MNSNKLAQVNEYAGLMHPAASSITWTAVAAVVGVTVAQAAGTTRTAYFQGDTLAITIAAAGRDFIDDVASIKFVDASKSNGCDDADGTANTAMQRLAGHKDVRTTATVLTETISNANAGGVGSTCAGGTLAATQVDNAAEGDANRQYFQCKSAIGLGRKACQDLGCTYTPPVKVSVGFAFADTTNFPASATTTTWRLCMVRSEVIRHMLAVVVCVHV